MCGHHGRMNGRDSTGSVQADANKAGFYTQHATKREAGVVHVEWHAKVLQKSVWGHPASIFCFSPATLPLQLVARELSFRPCHLTALSQQARRQSRSQDVHAFPPPPQHKGID